MTRATRRTTRTSAPSQPGSNAPASGAPDPAADVMNSQEDLCPACCVSLTRDVKDEDSESWVRCDSCKTWYHWRCVGENGQLDVIDKWFCGQCRAADSRRAITFKLPTRKSARNRPVRDYVNLHSGTDTSDPRRWAQLLENKTFSKDAFKKMTGSELTQDWLDSDPTAMMEPVIIEEPDGLGMTMPSSNLTVSEIAATLGHDTPLEVIDVSTQSSLAGWTLGKWASYYSSELSAREKVRNVISLEISGTKLGEQVVPPKLVRDIDWVEKFWPNNRKGSSHPYPKVQLYCLMGVAGAWTDWHIDFAGSSVYYHILRGSKTFLFIRPTAANLASYERWSGSEIQSHTWLGDLVDEVTKVDLREGNTMIIPTGWIHAVYTPQDALVFGGNFLHSYNAALQLRVREIEISTHVPKKFRFPLFSRLCWYVGEKYLRDLRAKDDFTPRVLESIEALSEFLVSEVRTMERSPETVKRDIRDQVPGDKVKDAPALARELRWRARLVGGYTSDGDHLDGAQGQEEPTPKDVGRKRKRDPEFLPTDLAIPSDSMFRNFRPKIWETVEEEHEESMRHLVADDIGPLVENLSGWKDEPLDGSGVEGRPVEAGRKRQVILKTRKTDRGFERQRTERVFERWSWDNAVSGEADVSYTSKGISPPAESQA
ncbi:JmjC domain-containing histone demethylation protein 1 [Lactarius deliciosus]|nr:JmjC domain-containing histone demethylation protein 1 [Lactarius deliciosus]